MNDIVRQHPAPLSLAPTNFAEAERFSDRLARSSFVPEAMRGKPGDILAAIQMGAEVGLAPMQALQNIAVIKGKPSIYGDAIPAICMGSPNFISIKEDDLKEITRKGEATCTVVRRGSEPVTRTFTVGDAKTAKLWGQAGPWSNYPSRMLQMRARAFACRDAFPDALRGLISREEAEDIPTVQATVRDVTPVERAEADRFAVAAAAATLEETPAPEDYVVTVKRVKRRVGDLDDSQLAYLAENGSNGSRDAAQAVLEKRIAAQTSLSDAELAKMARNDQLGMDGDDGRDELTGVS